MGLRPLRAWVAPPTPTTRWIDTATSQRIRPTGHRDSRRRRSPRAATSRPAHGRVHARDRSDWVLRKIADGTPFAFESQQKYDAVGAAVGVWLKERLVSLCGLEPLADVVPPATLYATPGVRAQAAAPRCELAPGSGPGDAGCGAARSASTTRRRGARCSTTIFRAIAAGWGVVVADPHGAAGAADAPPGGPRDHLPSDKGHGSSRTARRSAC